MEIKEKKILNYRLKLFILAILGFLIIIAPSIKGLYFISDYFVHLIGIFFTIGLVGFFLNRRFTLLLGFGFCGLISLLLKNETEDVFKKSKNDSTNKITTLLINLSDVNDFDNMFNAIHFKNPDVICFIELTPDWDKILQQKLENKYTYYFSKPSADFYGKAIFSKLPVINTTELGTDISTRLIKNSDTISIFTTYIHPISDENAEKIAESQFKIIVNHIKDEQHSCLVLGQFNQVYWSPQIKNFKLESGLKNCRNTTLPQFTEVQKENSFHNRHLTCDILNDFRLPDNTKTGIYTSYFFKKSGERNKR